MSDEKALVDADKTLVEAHNCGARHRYDPSRLSPAG